MMNSSHDYVTYYVKFNSVFPHSRTHMRKSGITIYIAEQKLFKTSETIILRDKMAAVRVLMATIAELL